MVVYRAGRKTHTDLYGPRVVWRRATGGGHMTRRDVERVRDDTSGIGPGPSGCRDGVGTGVERVITTSVLYVLWAHPDLNPLGRV